MTAAPIPIKRACEKFCVDGRYTESGKGDPVKQLDRRSNPAPDRVKSEYLPLIVSGAEPFYIS